VGKVATSIVADFSRLNRLGDFIHFVGFAKNDATLKDGEAVDHAVLNRVVPEGRA
jgi:hypothetical protein